MIIILGAGLTGLTLGYELNKKKVPFKIFEKEKRPGGLLKTEKKDGYSFDYTGHLLHFSDKNVEKFIKKELKLRLYKHRRNSFIFIKNKFIPYPFQYNLYYLPKNLRIYSLTEFIKAKTKNSISNNFFDWCINNFGKGISELFLIPYNKKLWNYDLKKLNLNWMGRFFPVPTENVIEGAISPFNKKYGYNAFFYYPKYGIEELIKKLNSQVEVTCNSAAKKINLKEKIITFSNGKIKRFKKLVSTIPLKILISIIEDAPENIKKMGKQLKASNVYCLNLGINKKIKNIHWIYFPEKKFPFYRIGFQSNFSNFVTPRNKTSLYIEISFKNKKPPEIKQKIIKSLKKLNIERKHIETELELNIPYAYVIYDKQREKNIPEILKFLNKNKVYTAGRFGNWQYSSMQESILEARNLVKNLV